MAVVAGRKSRVVLNGAEVRGCRSVVIEAAVDSAVLVKLELYASPRVEPGPDGGLVFILDDGPVSGSQGAVTGEPELEVVELRHRGLALGQQQQADVGPV